MATAQVEWLKGEIVRRAPGAMPEFVPVSTEGDRWAGPLSELGGKGAFISAVSDHVLRGDADVALHCLKDMPGDVPAPAGLMCLYPARDDINDVLVHPGSLKLDDLPPGTRVGRPPRDGSPNSGPRTHTSASSRYAGTRTPASNSPTTARWTR